MRHTGCRSTGFSPTELIGALRHDRIAIPNIWLAVAASLLLHLAFLAGWVPRNFLQPSDEGKAAGRERSLAIRIEPKPPAPPPPPVAPVQPTPPPAPGERPPRPDPLPPSPKAPAPRAPPRAAEPPRVMTAERPAPSVIPDPPVPPAPSAPPGTADFAAHIAARRRTREGAPAAPGAAAPAAPAESEQERNNRMVASRLGLDRPPTFGGDEARGGGIFQVVRVGYAEGELLFFGWNKAIARSSRQLVEVQRGSHRSTEAAILRRMIDIIREHERGDFVWESARLGRLVTLSARPQHDAELEAFLAREFFSVPR